MTGLVKKIEFTLIYTSQVMRTATIVSDLHRLFLDLELLISLQSSIFRTNYRTFRVVYIHILNNRNLPALFMVSFLINFSSTKREQSFRNVTYSSA
jgi:hypothetical protein